MKLLPFLNTTTQSSSSDHLHYPKSPTSPWRQWAASCAHLETLSFRATTEQGTALSKSSDNIMEMATEEAVTLSTRSEESAGSDHNIVDTVIRGLRTDRRHRLIFEPAGKSNSILDKVGTGGVRCGSSSFPYKESVLVSMDSNDPLTDFRSSMEEMIEAHGFRDWECLEELLGWYLKVNARGNHVYIIGAFIDLLAGLCSRSYYSSSSPSSAVPSSSSSSSRQSEKTETAARTHVAPTSRSSSSCSMSSSSFPGTCSPSPSSSCSTLSLPCSSSLDQVDEKLDDDDGNGEGEEICHLRS